MDLEYYPGPSTDDGVRTKFITDQEIALRVYAHNPARVMVKPHVGEMLYRMQSDLDYEPLGVVINAFPRPGGWTIKYRSDSGT